MEEAAVATAFLRRDGEVLACLRAEDAPTFPGRWAAISGAVEDDESPAAAARREVREAVGLESLSLARSGASLTVEVEEDGTEVVVHPVLFDVADAPPASAAAAEGAGGAWPEPGPEHDAVEWVSPTEFLRRETVPELWTAYERVAPTVQSVAADDEHGAATLSIRALEVLRDRAGLLAAAGESDRAELDALGRRLRRARPSMAVLRNRVNRALATADGAAGGGESASSEDAGALDDHDGSAGTPADVEAAAIDGIARALAADAEAAMRAASAVEGERVLTLSRSSTVRDALESGAPAAVYVAESRPAREGIGVAERLATATDAPVTVHTDAAVAHVLDAEPVDAVLVGADAVLPDGRVVNKTGTRTAALAAAREDVPVYVAAATDKVTTRESVNVERGDATAVYDGEASLDVLNPTFDVTPADAVAGIVTERGVLDPGDVAAVAAELREIEPS